ncbi:NADPH-adrenodoxin reductase [Umbelopsis nana]
MFNRSLVRAFSTAIRGRPMQVAVIGSGPAGFYTAHRVLKDVPDVKIDMFESLPVPHGLVRFGVAPDHPEVKNVMNKFDEVATDARFTFLGNVHVGGKDLPLSAIKPHYDAIIFSYGASEDRRLNIPGEDLRNVFSARAFVGWYNGLPLHRDLIPDLQNTDTAVVIGQGNVALDIARMLLSPIDELRKTDVTAYALEALSKSRIKHVHVVGRRGPLQAAFTAKELREQMKLPGVRFHTDVELLKNELAAGADYLNKSRPLKRLMGILEKEASAADKTTGDKSWTLDFLRSPTRILPDSNSETVKSIEYEINRLDGPPEARKAIGTGSYLSQDCGLVLRSIGYKSIALDDIPFDEARGLVPNMYGKVLDGDKEVPGLYTAGWLKRGPTGVIATTMNDAYETADTLAADLKDGKPFLGDIDGIEHKTGSQGLLQHFEDKKIRPISYIDWKLIEAMEFEAGQKVGKPREKFGRIEDMLAVLNAKDVQRSL